MYSTWHSKPQSKQNSDPLYSTSIRLQQIARSTKTASWRQIKRLLWRRLAFISLADDDWCEWAITKAAVWMSMSERGPERRRDVARRHKVLLNARNLNPTQQLEKCGYYSNASATWGWWSGSTEWSMEAWFHMSEGQYRSSWGGEIQSAPCLTIG